MAAATGGGYSLLGWIAGGAVVAAAGIGGLYYAGLLTPEPAPVETAAVPQAPATVPQVPVAAKPDPQDPPAATPDSTPEPSPAPQDDTEAVPTPTPVPDPVTAPKPDPQQASVATPEPQAKPDPIPVLPAPRFDVVRVDADGNTVIAGTGPAGSKVTVFLDDAAQDSAVTDTGGAFVSLLSIPPSPSPRILTLVAELAGQSVPSEDQIILAPTPQQPAQQPAQQTAQTDPQTAPQPTEQLAAAQTTPTPDPVTTADDTAEAVAETTAEATPETVEETVTDATSETQLALVETPATQPTAPPATTSPTTKPDTSMAQVATDPAQDVVATTPPAPAPADPAMTPSPDAQPTPVTTQTPVATAPTATAPRTPVQVATAEPASDAPPEPASEPAPETAQSPETGPVTATELASQPPSQTPSEPKPQTASVTATNPTPQQAPTPSVAATAPTPVTVLRAGADGVEVLQPSTLVPDLLDKIALDAISYSEEGQVQLSGRAQGHSIVRIYLDNIVVADMTADDRGNWSGKIGGIKPGIYTLRLDELDVGGAVLSRLETPFKRESPEALRPPQSPQGVVLAETPLIRAVTVQTGDTLWAISRERYGDGILYVRVFEANRSSIRDPDLIYPGQVFAIPE